MEGHGDAPGAQLPAVQPGAAPEEQHLSLEDFLAPAVQGQPARVFDPQYTIFDQNNLQFDELAGAVVPEGIIVSNVIADKYIDSLRDALDVQLFDRLRLYNFDPTYITTGSFFSPMRKIEPNFAHGHIAMDRRCGRHFYLYCKRCSKWAGGTGVTPTDFSFVPIARFKLEQIATGEPNGPPRGKKLATVELCEVFPHNKDCLTCLSNRFNNQISPSNGGSGMAKVSFDFQHIIGNVYHRAIEKLNTFQSPETVSAPGVPINNDQPDYPYDDRRYEFLPSLKDYFPEIHPEEHRQCMRRVALWYMNTFNCVFEFIPYGSFSGIYYRPNFVDVRDGRLPPDPDKSLCHISMLFGGHGFHPVNFGDPSVVEIETDPERLIHQPCHSDFPSILVDGSRCSVGANPRLQGVTKPGTIIIPIESPREVYRLNPSNRVEIVRGEALWMDGDTVHGGVSTIHSHRVKWRPVLHIHVSSLHHPHSVGNLEYSMDPETYLPEEHLPLLEDLHQRTIALRIFPWVQYLTIHDRFEREQLLPMISTFVLSLNEEDGRPFVEDIYRSFHRRNR